MVGEAELVQLVYSDPVENTLKPEVLSTKTKLLSSESEITGLKAYVLCPDAVKEPVDAEAEMDYLIPLYVKIGATSFGKTRIGSH